MMVRAVLHIILPRKTLSSFTPVRFWISWVTEENLRPLLVDFDLVDISACALSHRVNNVRQHAATENNEGGNDEKLHGNADEDEDVQATPWAPVSASSLVEAQLSRENKV